MKTYNKDEFICGWFIGDFPQSILRTKDFEIAVQEHKAHSIPEPHYQEIATEYNYVVSGSLVANGQLIEAGDLFVYEPLEVCDVTFMEDTTIVVVKTPSLPDDKVLV